MMGVDCGVWSVTLLYLSPRPTTARCPGVSGWRAEVCCSQCSQPTVTWAGRRFWSGSFKYITLFPRATPPNWRLLTWTNHSPHSFWAFAFFPITSLLKFLMKNGVLNITLFFICPYLKVTGNWRAQVQIVALVVTVMSGQAAGVRRCKGVSCKWWW